MKHSPILANPARPRARNLGVALLLLGCLLIPGCFTTLVWGGEMEEEEVYDFKTGLWYDETSPTIELDEDIGSRGIGDIWVKIALTPLAVALDAITYPVQEWIFDWEDEKDPAKGRWWPRSPCERKPPYQEPAGW